MNLVKTTAGNLIKCGGKLIQFVSSTSNIDSVIRYTILDNYDDVNTTYVKFWSGEIVNCTPKEALLYATLKIGEAEQFDSLEEEYFLEPANGVIAIGEAIIYVAPGTTFEANGEQLSGGFYIIKELLNGNSGEIMIMSSHLCFQAE